MSEESDPGGEASLSERAGVLLVRLARSVVSGELGVADPFDPQQARDDAALQEWRSVFVTIEKDGSLRGCIGFMEPTGPLHETVERAALAAAFQDSRFSPLRGDELAATRFEVSVLSRPAEDSGARPTLPDRVTVGRDGLMVEHLGRRGVLLPQVAAEWGWDARQFLSQTCLKAGLPRDSWKDPSCKVFLFQSQVFRDRR